MMLGSRNGLDRINDSTYVVFPSLIDEQDLNFSVRLDPAKTNQSINQEHNLPAGQLGYIIL